MFFRKERIEFLTIFLNVLFSPSSGFTYDLKKRIIRLVTCLFVIQFEGIWHGKRVQQPETCRRNLFLFFFVFETWWGYILLISLLLLILWFYRRYEIIRIKHQNHFQNQIFQNRMLQEGELSGNRHLLKTEEKLDQCLTDLSEKRFCFFSNNENLIRIDDGVNAYQEPATVGLLLSKIDGDKFCCHLCREKENKNFQVSKFIPKETFNTNNNITGSLSYQHLVKPTNHSIKLNHTGNLFYLLNHKQVIYPGDTPISPFDEEFILNTVKIIEVNYSDYRFSAELLAQELNMSISQVNRKLNALAGVAAGQLIRTFRLQRASELLIHNAITISDISYSTGYNELAYFSRAFKKEFGCTPSVYRKLMTKKSISMRKIDN